jgi:hypothetical protein
MRDEQRGPESISTNHQKHRNHEEKSTARSNKSKKERGKRVQILKTYSPSFTWRLKIPQFGRFWQRKKLNAFALAGVIVTKFWSKSICVK